MLDVTGQVTRLLCDVEVRHVSVNCYGNYGDVGDDDDDVMTGEREQRGFFGSWTV